MADSTFQTLRDRRVVVLGGTSGIGLAIAQAAAAEGADVVVASSTAARVQQALSSLPASARGEIVDLSQEMAVEALFDRIGAFDHLVYTAGESLQGGPIADAAFDASRRFFDTRFWGAWLAVKHGASSIRSGGSIVLTSGSAGLTPHAGWTLGASVCAAMEGLMRALAVELAPVRVNLVAPGVVRSPLWNAMTESDREALYRDLGGQLLTRRVGEVDEVAQAYLFLMKQGFSTGQVVRVDGGAALA